MTDDPNAIFDDLEYNDPELALLDGGHTLVRSRDLDNLAFALHQFQSDRRDPAAISALAGYAMLLIEHADTP